MSDPVHTLAELRVFQKALGKAIASPLKAAWFDDFRKEMLPYSELAQRLEWVKREIAAHPDNTDVAVARSKFRAPRASSGL